MPGSRRALGSARATALTLSPCLASPASGSTMMAVPPTDPADLPRRRVRRLRDLVEAKGGQVDLGVPAGPRRGRDRRAHRRDHPRRARSNGSPLVDEILVIDDHSTDRTADVAAAAGAKVLQAEDILPEYGAGHGKGEALWKSLYVSAATSSSGATPTSATSTRCSSSAWSVRCCPARPRLRQGASTSGRSSQEPARRRPGHRAGGPADRRRCCSPQLAPIVQPLAGEYAGRREAARAAPVRRGLRRRPRRC